jgi:pyrroline-5-carboxylate reductase
MQIGLLGSGNMARALARGWKRPVLATDVVAERAAALTAEVGGEVVASNAELARRADVLVLCHKPAQLEAIAVDVAPESGTIISLLGGVPLERLRAAYPGRAVYRIMPNIAAEVGAGVTCLVADDAGDAAAYATVRELLGEVGTVVEVDESQINVAMTLMSVQPAFLALVAEAQIDAAIRRGMPEPLAGELVGAAIEGCAALLRARGMDTLGVRRQVTSPGGVTARGLRALEAGGLRAAFDDAMDASLEGLG